MTPEGFRECPKCGKEFRSNGSWVYKIQQKDGLQVFCSWTCYRAVQSEIEKQKRIQRNKEKLERARALA
jgi:uncharacterized Zn finger protein (UPF0148 family)